MRRFLKSDDFKTHFSYLLIIILGSFLVSYVAILICTSFLEPANTTDIYSIENIFLLKIIQLISALGVFIFPSLFYIYTTDNILERKTINYQQILLILSFILFIFPTINFLVTWNSSLHLPDFCSSLEDWIRSSELEATLLTEAFLTMNNVTDLFQNLFLMALIPAIGEELLFRGILQKLLYKWTKNIHVSVLIIAFLFSAIHLQFLGFFARFLLGAFLGYIYIWGRSIYLPMIAHFINNALAILIAYLIQNDQLNFSFDTIGAEGGVWLYVSLIGSSVFIYLIKQISSE